MKRGLTRIPTKEVVLFRVATLLGVGLQNNMSLTCPGTLWAGKTSRWRPRCSVPAAPAGLSPGRHGSRQEGQGTGLKASDRLLAEPRLSLSLEG